MEKTDHSYNRMNDTGASFFRLHHDSSEKEFLRLLGPRDVQKIVESFVVKFWAVFLQFPSAHFRLTH